MSRPHGSCLHWLVGALISLGLAGGAHAANGTFDLLLDLDRDGASGCNAPGPGGPIPGIERILRTTIDLDTQEVTAITLATCVDPPTDTFGPEVPVGAPFVPPWNAVPGEGTSGSTLIETQLPLSAVVGTGAADAYATFSAAAGTDELLTTNGSPSGAPIRLHLGLGVLPSLSGASLLLLAFLLGFAGIRRLAPATRTPATVALLVVAASASPLAVRAALGDGTLRIWGPSQALASDTAGDAPEGADILSLYAAVDPQVMSLLIRLDVMLGPAICLDWGTVDPGSGFPCNMNPPPDPAPFNNLVALTFDDGPNPATTPSILATLRAENVPATFFQLGRNLETPQEQALALEIYNDPLFLLANHTYDHSSLDLLPLEEATAEVLDGTAQLQLAIGDPCFYPRYFRFPRGRSTCTEVQMVRELGMAVTGVNIDPKDWCYGASPVGFCSEPQIPVAYRNDMIGYLLYRFQQTNGGIVLMHDPQSNTATNLPAIITALRAAGANFVPLDDLQVFPLLNSEINLPAPPACCDGVVN